MILLLVYIIAPSGKHSQQSVFKDLDKICWILDCNITIKHTSVPSIKLMKKKDENELKAWMNEIVFTP